MDLSDRITQLASQAEKQRGYIENEEATKTALIMPFINALGYNVFDATEVVPEYTADVGTKKGEKVDYAIMKDGSPIILIEAKTLGTNLGDVHTSQLYRYFSVTDARFGILTDGVVYRFFSDLDAPNKMDEKPFLVFDLFDFSIGQIDELKRFSKTTFDIDDILSTASELMYTREIKSILAAEFASPSEEFVRLFTGQVYTRLKTQAVITEFTELTKRAFRGFVNDRIEQRLKTALDREVTATEEVPVVEIAEGEELPDDDLSDSDDGGIVTTQDEFDAYLIIKAILREIIDIKRVAMRDVRSYCGILLDDNNRKPICRLYFNRAQKYLGVFDGNKDEERIPIEDIDEIYQYADQIKAVVLVYDEPDE